MKEGDRRSESWVEGLADFVRKSEGVEAVMIEEGQRKLSIATVGNVDEAALKKILAETIARIEEEVGGKVANGTGLQGVKVERVGQKTLIRNDTGEEVKMWVWREMPWPEMMRREEEEEEDWRWLLALAVICGITGVAGYIMELVGIWGDWGSGAMYIISVLTGGWDAMKDVLKKIPKGQLDIHFLMVAVVVGAVSIGAWKEGALLLFLFSLSGALEHLAKDRTKGAIEALFKIAPKIAIMIKDGEEVEIQVDDVEVGMQLLVKAGQMVPVDGEVFSGQSGVDESNLTGESIPVEKGLGDDVYSGTMNLWGALKIKVIRRARESSLQKIIKLIQEAQHLKAPSQRFTDKFGTPYTYGILSLVIVMFFVWWLGFQVNPFQKVGDSYSAFYRSMTLLVVASPCALVLSIPSAILAAIASGARKGVLFRGGAAIEKLSEVDMVALDKTGTLTTGELEVVRVESFPKGREEEIAEIAYGIEIQSTHPIARAIVRYGKERGIKRLEVSNFKSLVGKGVQGDYGGDRCVLGRRGLLESGPLKDWIKDVPSVGEEYSEVWVVSEGLIGRLLLKDTIRVESKPVLESLSKMGIKTVMLTGDRRESAESVGKALGISEVKYGMSPEKKVEAIKAYAKDGYKVAMVGDGVNDAPSLAASYVPVAMGARGSDAALEQSEVVLMNDRIDNFLWALKISLRAERIIKINLAISLMSIGVMVVLGMFGIVPLTLGVLTHEGSTVFVCLNSLRLLVMK